ncbi:MAG TPA: cysteine desulfurase family protein [Candidatus Diapherotrites archaeon]|nr:cysteine desulfurase family protein [Candidatus Diapherotrites archaeon]
MKKEIYLDNAATTPVSKEVLKEMLPYFTKKYGNPSSFHTKGLEAKNAITNARQKISKILNCEQQEIIFTSGGSEANNLAIFGFLKKYANKGKHIITTKIEHHSVLEGFQYLEKHGFEVTYLNVNKKGIIDINDFQKAIKKNTIFASIIYANNEIGVIQDIPKIAKICKQHNIVLHTDACQATTYLSVDVKKLGVDLMTINGSKIYAPKGIGLLYKNKNIEIEPIIYGGGQEQGLRSGTENVPGIIGLAKALEIAERDREKNIKHTKELSNYFITEILKIPNTILNGDRKKRLPNNINISFLNIEGESFLLKLNKYNIYASTGSACSSYSLEPSHVIMALYNNPEIAHSSIRFSLGVDNTLEEIKYTIKIINKIVKELRSISAMNHNLKEVIK